MRLVVVLITKILPSNLRKDTVGKRSRLRTFFAYLSTSRSRQSPRASASSARARRRSAPGTAARMVTEVGFPDIVVGLRDAAGRSVVGERYALPRMVAPNRVVSGVDDAVAVVVARDDRPEHRDAAVEIEARGTST